MIPHINLVTPVGLSSDQLNTPAERKYFVIALIISLIAWFLLAVSPTHGTYSIVRTSEGYAVVCSDPQHSIDKLRKQGGL